LDTKKTLSAGLLLSAFGSFMFVLQPQWRVFLSFFLTALFTVGLGFSIQQIVANPLAIKMGSPDTTHRLTLAGGINSLNYYWCYFTRNRIIRNGK
jgi:FHS family L-fucose permease-like MFS transporter